jgi:hypothetical protein
MSRTLQSLIRDLEHSVRVLSDQVKFLTMNATNPHRMPSDGSPAPSMTSMAPQPLHRQQNLPPSTQSTYATQPHSNYPQQTQPPAIHGPWYTTPNIAAPQASHPIAPPPPPPPLSSQRSPPAPSEEWDDTYLAVLGTQDPKQLRELLARSNPEVVMPLNGPGPLSQAVILTLLHRVCFLVSYEFLCINVYSSALSSLRLWERHRLLMRLSSLHFGGFNGPPLYSTLTCVFLYSSCSNILTFFQSGAPYLPLHRARRSQCQGHAPYYETASGNSPWRVPVD